MKFILTTIMATLLVIFAAASSEAGFLYHATKRAAANRIMRSGFTKSHMNPSSRFGAKAYLASQPSNALRERPGADTVLRFKSNGNFNKNLIDTRRMKTADLKVLSGRNDMRGTTKNGIIGPRLGHDIGRKAERSNSIIAYRSAKNPHSTNYAFPEKTYRNSSIFRPDKVISVN